MDGGSGREESTMTRWAAVRHVGGLPRPDGIPVEIYSPAPDPGHRSPTAVGPRAVRVALSTGTTLSPRPRMKATGSMEGHHVNLGDSDVGEAPHLLHEIVTSPPGWRDPPRRPRESSSES